MRWGWGGGGGGGGVQMQLSAVAFGISNCRVSILLPGCVLIRSIRHWRDWGGGGRSWHDGDFDLHHLYIWLSYLW